VNAVPKKRTTVYLTWPALRMLAIDGDTSSLNFALGTFAQLVAERGRRLADGVPAQWWAILHAALGPVCRELLQEGSTWQELVRWRVEDWQRGTSELPAKQRSRVQTEASGLLDAIDIWDELDCVAVLAAVRHYDGLCEVGREGEVGWWEPSLRLRDFPAGPPQNPAVKATKRRKRA